MSTNDPARRGFLRSLASLPLIGGGVTLIGSPTAAAEPITSALLDSYEAWLFYERRTLRWERFGRNAPPGLRVDNPGAEYHRYGPTDPKAVDRAAVVLAAVGCDWREDGR